MAEKEKNVAEVETKQTKPEKVKKEKKGRIKNAWKGFRSELKKIVWPTWKQVLKNTGIVLVIVIACAAVILALDVAFREGFDALVEWL
jgi:preprotein translocase subunit SecE